MSTNNEPAAHPRRLLLIGWDAADWRLLDPLLDEGHLPALARLVESGVCGGLTTLEPSVCAANWTSIATGQYAFDHGILGSFETDTDDRHPRLSRSDSRLTPAVWNYLEHAGVSCSVVGWPASYPAEPVSGAWVSDLFHRAVGPRTAPWPVAPDCIQPAALVATLAELRVHPGEIDADQIRAFVPDFANIDLRSDRRVDEIARILAETASVHAAVTWLLANSPTDCVAVHYDALHAFSRSFMSYYPPRMEHVPDADFERYRRVMDAAARFHDQMLARLVELAGPDVTILLVSDHGYQSGQHRPMAGAGGGADAQARWHRNEAMLCLSGPGIRRDYRVHGADVLDIAPTVLALFGLETETDFPGHVITEVFDDKLALAPVPPLRGTWQSSRSSKAEQMLPLPELGYLQLRDIAVPQALREIQSDRDYCLARSYLGAERPAQARPVLERLLCSHPGDYRFQTLLALVLYALGDLAACRVEAEALLRRHQHAPTAELLMGLMFHQEGRTDDALASVRRAERADADLPRLHQDIGVAYLQMALWPDALRAFARALDVDAESATAHDGMARAYLELGRTAEAVREARAALGFRFDMTSAHIHLGLALADSGEPLAAIRAFETALSVDSNLTRAHYELARLHEVHTGDLAQVVLHRSAASVLAGK